MDLVEYHTVENRVRFNDEQAFTQGIDKPLDWLWSFVNNAWQPIVEVPRTEYCNCIGCCAKKIKADYVICEDETFNLKR